MDDAVAQHDIIDVVVLELVRLLHQEAHCRRQLLCGAARVRAPIRLCIVSVVTRFWMLFGVTSRPARGRRRAAPLSQAVFDCFSILFLFSV